MAELPIKAFGWAARDSSAHFSPWNFTRRETGETDVRLKILYTGICRADYEQSSNVRGTSVYPLLPGHEITGIVTEVGSKVKKFKVGDNVAVGTMVSSCGVCNDCTNNLEIYCPKNILTYNNVYYDGNMTYGGYSDHIVVDEKFCFVWPKNLPLDRGAPLVCAGITPYSAIKFFGLDKPDLNIGVLGVGGMGHLAVKYAKAFGSKVTVISTTPDKKEITTTHLGADVFIYRGDANAMQAATDTLDAIIDTSPAVHPLNDVLPLMKNHAKYIIIGAPASSFELPPMPLLLGRKIMAGSLVGGLKETQELLDFSAEHGIYSDIEIIPIDYVNEAMDRLIQNDVHFRFVIDVANSLKKPNLQD